MSPNQLGKIVARVTHPRGAASDLKQKRHSTPRPQPPAGDIIEISSDEDEEAQPPPKRPSRATSSRTHNPDYNVRLSRKDREIEKLKKREKELEQAVATLKNEAEAKKPQNIPKVDEIEEELTCDICAMRMWTPYRLTECGHVFCLRCLLNWFDQVHAKFIGNHPGYVPLPPHIMAVLRRPLDFPQELSRAYAYLSQFPGPQYVCPSCRTAVTRRPIEDFKVKTLVSWLGSVQGIQPPKPGIPPGKGDTVFDGYSLL